MSTASTKNWFQRFIAWSKKRASGLSKWVESLVSDSEGNASSKRVVAFSTWGAMFIYNSSMSDTKFGICAGLIAACLGLTMVEPNRLFGPKP